MLQNQKIKSLLPFIIIFILAFINIYMLKCCECKKDVSETNSTHLFLTVSNMPNISEQQIKDIRKIEERFLENRKKYDLLMNQANKNLLSLIKNNENYPQEVKKIVHNIHMPMAELQELTVKYYFDVYKVLDSDQQKLLKNYITSEITKMSKGN